MNVAKDFIFNNVHVTNNLKIPKYDLLNVADPNSGLKGNLAFNRANSTFYGHDGTQWVSLTGGANVTLTSAGGDVSLVADGAGPTLEIKGLTAGSGLTLTSDATSVTIDTNSVNWVGNTSSTITDITGDGTVYTLALTASVAQNCNYNGTNVTIPISGLYSISVYLAMTGIAAGHTEANVYLSLNGTDEQSLLLYNPFILRSTVGTILSQTFSINCYLTAETIINANLVVSGSTKTVDLNGVGTTQSAMFSGTLLQKYP